MDKNKLRLLEDNSYRIKECCALCAHSKFAADNTLFGTCKRLLYSHLKHSDRDRQMSINRYGLCVNFFELDEKKLRTLTSDFTKFFQK